MDLRSTITLRNGVEMPRFGLGVFRAAGSTRDAVTWALEAGYRHVDTAHIYRNEEDVGAALAASAVPRDEVFVTTKLWNEHHGYDAALRAFDASCAALGLETIDLWLIHWPAEKRRESWRAMEKVLGEGRARAIGVSNYLVRHLEELRDAEVQPMVNQIELHPFCQQPEVVGWCRAHDVVVEAYSPVTKGKKLDDPTLVRVGSEVNRTPAQVLIRWSLQRGFVCIPKSSNRERIQQNAGVFDFVLDETAMATLDALHAAEHLAWDPRTAP